MNKQQSSETNSKKQYAALIKVIDRSKMKQKEAKSDGKRVIYSRGKITI